MAPLQPVVYDADEIQDEILDLERRLQDARARLKTKQLSAPPPPSGRMYHLHSHQPPMTISAHHEYQLTSHLRLTSYFSSQTLPFLSALSPLAVA